MNNLRQSVRFEVPGSLIGRENRLSMRIHVTRKICQAALTQLFATGWDIFVGPEEQPSRQRFVWAAGGAVGLLTLPTETVDVEVMDRCPDLRVISQCAGSVENIDLEEADRRGIVVSHTSEPSSLLDEDAHEQMALEAVTNLIEALKVQETTHRAV